MPKPQRVDDLLNCQDTSSKQQDSVDASRDKHESVDTSLPNEAQHGREHTEGEHRAEENHRHEGNHRHERNHRHEEKGYRANENLIAMRRMGMFLLKRFSLRLLTRPRSNRPST
jgi:hypothetical protein